MNNPTSRPLAVLFLAIFSWHAAAQDKPADIPAPQPPFINRAPARADWTMAFTSNATAPAVTPATMPDSSNAKPPPRVIKEIRVSKSGSNYREITAWSDGTTSEKWDWQGLVLVDYPETQKISIFNVSTDPLMRMAFPTHDSSDFPELSWLTSSAYAGIKNYKQQSCYYFDAKIAPGSSGAPPPGANLPGATLNAPLRAWIDTQTRLPVALEVGSLMRIYTFNVSPPGPLELPDRFSKELQEYQKALSEPDRNRMKIN